MSIEPTLAKGLTKRFIRENNELVYALLKSFQKIENINSKKQWGKFISDTRKKFKSCTIQLYEGGSNKHPYFGVGWLDEGTFNPQNEWDEQVLFYNFLIATFDPRQTTFSKVVTFDISHHVIQRLYQRLPSQTNSSFSNEAKFIINELETIPFWTFFWLNFLINIDMEKDLCEKISLPIPAQEGLFLCRISEDKAHVLVRTYIHNSQLRKSQTIIKNEILNASREFISSPFCFIPDICIQNLFNHRSFDVIYKYFLNRINRNMKDILLFILSDITNEIEQRDLLTKRIESLVVNELKGISSEMFLGVETLLSTGDFRTFETLINKAILQS